MGEQEQRAAGCPGANTAQDVGVHASKWTAVTVTLGRIQPSVGSGSTKYARWTGEHGRALAFHLTGSHIQSLHWHCRHASSKHARAALKSDHVHRGQRVACGTGVSMD